ncbi:MAG: squalene/phytoene synthase family protein [Nocardiopsaceae bacterium]|jgi:phytoene synthase|nr:squalene/phytoene synthase family protein [Nocardiopsaceae bacterium]
MARAQASSAGQGSGSAAGDLAAAYRECERITRQQAKNFAYGIALLPGDKRRALSAVYAFARRVDDIGDGTMAAADKIAALNRARGQITSLHERGSTDPVLIALRDASTRFAIPLGAFGELIDGCEADVRGTSYSTFGELEHYCRCVAGSIGRLSLGIFGSRDPAAAEPLADSLGIALQLTNIMRDIKEDLGNGRVYLPAEDIARFGCTLTPGGNDGQGVLGGDLGELIRFEAERAKSWYATGLRLMPLLDRRSAASAGAMASIYFRLLEHICAAPQAALERRMSLPAGEKAMVAASALAGLAWRRAARNGSGGRASVTNGQAGPA